jgi:hypothetical protein
VLTRSFCCLEGLSPEAERRLWRTGCLAWDHLPLLAHRLFSARRTAALLAQLPLLRAALDGRAADFFLTRLPPGHRARVWPAFAAGTAFLDLETAGLGSRDPVTVAGMLLDGRLHQFVRGRNLEDFLRLWRRVEVLVTFNGAAFDVPRLLRCFGLTTVPPHIDLMTEGRPWGQTGTLKTIERRLGMERLPDEEGDGEQAAELWRRYAGRGDNEALARLLRYNARDVRSLPRLAENIWRRSLEGCPQPPPSWPAS